MMMVPADLRMGCKKRQAFGLDPQEVQDCMRWHRRAYEWQRLHVLSVVGIVESAFDMGNYLMDLFAAAESRRRQNVLGDVSCSV